MHFSASIILIKIFIVLNLLWISGCGSSDSGSSTSTTTLTGTAAVGAAIASEQVRVVDANGNITLTTTNALGEFSVVVSNSPPFMLETVFNGERLFSFSDAGGVANITPMTNLALHEAFKSGSSYESLESIFDNFDMRASALSVDDIRQAQSQINANIVSLLGANGLPNGYNIFTTPFDADSTGIDAVLDAIDIVIDALDLANITISINDGIAFSFDIDIDISNFDIIENSDSGNGGNENPSLPSALAGTVWNLVYDFAQANSPYQNGDHAQFTFSSSGRLFIDTDPDQSNGDEIQIDSFSMAGSEYQWTDSVGGYVYSVSLNGESLNEINVIPVGSSAFVGQFVMDDNGSDIENLGLVTALAGTYTVDSTASGTHDRGSITIGSDGAIDFDTNVQFSQSDIGVIFDRTFIAEMPRVQINYGANDDEDAILIFLNPADTTEVQSIQYRVTGSGINVEALVSEGTGSGGGEVTIDPQSNWDIYVSGTTNGIAINNLYSTTVTGALVPTAQNFEETLRPFVAGIGGIGEEGFTTFSVQYVSGTSTEVVVSLNYAFTVTIGSIVSNQTADVTWRYLRQ